MKWFPAWLLVGAAFATSVVTVYGVVLLPFVIILIVLLSLVRDARRGYPGFIAGAGVPLLYVAWLNRRGPGNICTRYARGGQSCVEQMTPWPWFILGAGLLAAGILLAVKWHVRTRGV